MQGRMWRLLTALLALVLLVVACEVMFWSAPPPGECWVDELPKHPCNAELLVGDGQGIGMTSGLDIIEWYGEDALGPGVHTFHIRNTETGAEDYVTFELTG